MAFLDHNGESEFPLSKDLVFEAMRKAIPLIKGMKIEQADKLQGRIMVKSEVSAFSWGENIPIQLIFVSENLTKVKITSSPKTGMMLGGGFDMGKNRKNIETILTYTSSILSSRNSEDPNSGIYDSRYQKSSPWYKKTWVIVLFVLLLAIIFSSLGKW